MLATLPEVVAKQRISGIKFLCAEAAKSVEKILAYECPLCHRDFDTLNPLRHHLREKHNRMYCDLCLMFNGKFIGEQKIYPINKIQEHVEFGEFGPNEQLVMPHLYCEFCGKYMFDEDKLLKHLRNDHFSCEICGEDAKFTFYKGIYELELHFKESHIICPDPLCI